MEYKGFWFLPGQEDNQVAGIMTVEKDISYKLELIGGFDNDLQSILSSEKKDVIFGEVYNDENHIRKITLINCYSSFNVNFSAKHPITHFDCSVVVDGLHVNDLDSNFCVEIRADLSSLYNWKNTGIIKRTWQFSKEPELISNPGNISIDLNLKDYWEIPVEINDTTKLVLFADSNYDTSSDYMKSTIQQFTRIRIESKTPTSINYLYRKLYLFQQFLSFATLNTVCINKLWVYSNDYYEEIKGKKINNPAYIYLKPDEKCNEESEIKKSDFLFKFSDISDDFEFIIKKWFEVSDEIAPIRNHLIESIKPIRKFSSVNFLIVIQALEGFHRKFRVQEWKKLRVRLKSLVDEFSNIEEIKEISELDIKHTVASRDYYSHFLIDKEDVLEGVELYYLTMKIKKLLICCVLNLVGFDNEKINKLFKKNNRI